VHRRAGRGHARGRDWRVSGRWPAAAASPSGRERPRPGDPRLAA
jgi:hypothetical protein